MRIREIQRSEQVHAEVRDRLIACGYKPEEIEETTDECGITSYKWRFEGKEPHFKMILGMLNQSFDEYDKKHGTRQ